MPRRRSNSSNSSSRRSSGYSGSMCSPSGASRSGRFLLGCSENILAPSDLSDCEEAINLGSMTATEVFASLRNNSILHLFASIGRSLGLKVYERCLTTLRIPKPILHGSDLLLMWFPQCGNHYYLLMQLDKDFKPLFDLLETQPEQGGKSHSIGEADHVFRFNTIDINQMQMVEDESNFALLDWKKLQSLPNVDACNLVSEHNLLSEFGMEPTLQLPGCSEVKFSSIVDEVFGLDKTKGETSFSVQSYPSLSFNASTFSQAISSGHQGLKAAVGVPKLDGGMQHSQHGNAAKVSTGASGLNSSLYGSNNLKGILNNTTSSSSSPGRITSLRSPHSGEIDQLSAMFVDQVRNSSPKDAGGLHSASRPLQLLSPLRASGRIHSAKQKSLKSLPVGGGDGFSKDTTSSSLITAPICQAAEPERSLTSGPDCVSGHAKTSRKRSLSDILMLIPSLEGLQADTGLRKRRKISELALHLAAPQVPSSLLIGKTGGYKYGGLLVEAIYGLAPSKIYLSGLLQVVRHSSLCIKHARLTSQMDALLIPYVEEAGLRIPSSNLWFRLPFAKDDSWKHICLQLGKPGSMYWDVKINDRHFQELWQLYKGSTNTPWGNGVRIANISDTDSHIHYDPEGVVLSYKTVEADSIKRLVSDLQRLSNARLFACVMRELIVVRPDDKIDDSSIKYESKVQNLSKGSSETGNKLSEQMRKFFKIEAVSLLSLWFSYGSMPVMTHFVVEWEAGKEGCTMHVSPDHLWPHTKFSEDFINGGEVASFLDCIRLTAGPLVALAAAIPPARMSGPVSVNTASIPKQTNFSSSQGLLPSNVPPSNAIQSALPAPMGCAVVPSLGSNQNNLHNAATLSSVIRGGSGTVPSSLLPIDVSVVLRSPYWIRIIYRKKFAVDMRCFAGDQVWLQPATPPKGGPAAGGSLPCPQFRPFLTEHVAQGLNSLEPNFPGGGHNVSSSNTNQGPGGTQHVTASNIRPNVTAGSGMPRPNSAVGNQGTGNMNQVSNAILPSGMPLGVSSGPVRVPSGTGVPVHDRGELNTAFIGLGDDGGYGGGWVPLAALKKVLRGILKYLGVLWLFAQSPDLLKEILGSILKDNEGALLNLDQEQPALRFFVGSYVFTVSVHRVQLLLQVLSVKRFHPQQQQQAQSSAQEELSASEISEISDYFSRRVASEPYDASRVASFITLLTLPISVLREFLKLIAWKKTLSQAHGGDIASAQKARIELCLENHSGKVNEQSEGSSSASRSNIHHDRAHSSVDFALTYVLDAAHIPHINAAGGAAWLPYCVSVRLKFSFGESSHISFLEMNGSHRGRACWKQVEDWEKCKQRLIRTVEYANGNSVGDASQGRLKLVAENMQRALLVSLQQLRDGLIPSGPNGT